MNIERGISNTMIVAAREVETHYLLVFVSVDTGGSVRCVVENEAAASGPLLLTFTETDSPTATDGEVTLAPGDWKLTIYGQNSATNIDTTLVSRTVWSELITVSGDYVAPPTGDGCLTLVEQIEQTGAQGTVDAIDEAGETAAVQALICDTSGSCPMTVTVTVNGTLEETLVDVDPCEDNTVNIVLS